MKAILIALGLAAPIPCRVTVHQEKVIMQGCSNTGVTILRSEKAYFRLYNDFAGRVRAAPIVRPRRFIGPEDFIVAAPYSVIADGKANRITIEAAP